MKRKLFCVLLSLMMVVTMMPIMTGVAFADETGGVFMFSCEGDFATGFGYGAGVESISDKDVWENMRFYSSPNRDSLIEDESALEFPAGAGTFTYQGNGYWNWDPSNATKGTYLIKYNDGGVIKSCYCYVCSDEELESNRDLYLTTIHIYTGMGRPIGEIITGIKFYHPITQEVLTYKDGIVFPKGAGKYKYLGDGEWEWDSSTAKVGEYQIKYKYEGEVYSINVYVYDTIDHAKKEGLLTGAVIGGTLATGGLAIGKLVFESLSRSLADMKTAIKEKSINSNKEDDTAIGNALDNQKSQLDTQPKVTEKDTEKSVDKDSKVEEQKQQESVKTETVKAETTVKNDSITKGIKNTTIKVNTEFVMNYYGEDKIKISWTKSKGYKVDYYEVYRSTSKDSGFKKIYTTKSGTAKSFTNTSGITKFKTYYYKVRGVREVNGKKVYTKWSNVKRQVFC